jgi:hypothetical protein
MRFPESELRYSHNPCLIERTSGIPTGQVYSTAAISSPSALRSSTVWRFSQILTGSFPDSVAKNTALDPVHF